MSDESLRAVSKSYTRAMTAMPHERLGFPVQLRRFAMQSRTSPHRTPGVPGGAYPDNPQ